VTIVAAGTSAPELVTSVNAALKGRAGISVGNLIGSDLFNMLGVLGMAAIIQPLSIAPNALSGIWMLLGNVIFVFILMRTGWRITRLQGLLLILVNLVRWYIDIQGSTL
jgi:cation:H+ antiporter